LSRYTPPDAALQASFEFGSVVGWHSPLCKPQNWARTLSQACLSFTNAVGPSFGGKAVNTRKIVCCNRALFLFLRSCTPQKLGSNQSAPVPGVAFSSQSNIRTHFLST
jgi:hypothetical protein